MRAAAMVHDRWAFVAGFSMLAAAAAMLAAGLVITVVEFDGHVAALALTLFLTLLAGSLAWSLLLHSLKDPDSEN